MEIWSLTVRGYLQGDVESYFKALNRRLYGVTGKKYETPQSYVNQSVIQREYLPIIRLEHSNYTTALGASHPF
jgi:hypothetical protein